MSGGILASLLPAEVAAAEATGEELDGPLPPLLPLEEAGLGAGAVHSRRVSYHWGRTLARRAMAALGAAPAPVQKGASHEPLWPAGYVGSITHCTGYCAAAVARTSEWISVGIDAEVVQPLVTGVVERIATPSEREWLAGCADAERAAVALFSAKEAVYKAWFPLARSWLGFQDATVDLEGGPTGQFEGGRLTARLLVDGPLVGTEPLAQLSGYYGCRGGLVFAAVAVRSPDAAQTSRASRFGATSR